jgi:hypothetical protein
MNVWSWLLPDLVWKKDDLVEYQQTADCPRLHDNVITSQASA